jgi:ElaB/YqjD/DUF883 family membrane-anchored ribosome-binding protein
MPSNINEYLETLLKDSSKFAGDELKNLISEAKDDNRLFIKHIGEMTEDFIKMRALGKITNDELKELMSDLLDLNKMQFYKLSNDAQVRAQKIVNGISELVLNKLLSLI